MKVKDIEADLASLRELEKRDTDAASAGADVLRCQVLQAIASGAKHPRKLARAALVTCDEDIALE